MKLSLFPILFVFASRSGYHFDIIRFTNKIYQIHGHYPLYNYEKKMDIFRYRSKARRKFKRIVFPKKSVEDHHIIPKQFSNHPLIKETNFDISCSKNILIMFSAYSRNFENELGVQSIYHEHGHRKYNEYVLGELNYIHEKYSNIEEKQYHLSLLLNYLTTKIMNKSMYNQSDFPWN